MLYCLFVLRINYGNISVFIVLVIQCAHTKVIQQLHWSIIYK